MAEEVLDLLVKIPGISVIGRTSSFQFKGQNDDLRTIGSKLGAAYVLEGSVRKSGDRLRVTAQLIDTATGAHLWSETYDEGVGDTVKIQERIAASFVRSVQVTLGAGDFHAAPDVKNSLAYDLYLRGLYVSNRGNKAGYEEAADYFRQALALDPSFARAAYWLSNTEETLAEMAFVPSREGFAKARASAERGLELAPRSGEIVSLLALIHALYDKDTSGAEQEAQRTLALDPNNVEVLINVCDVYIAVGRPDEAVRHCSAAVVLDPLSGPARVILASALTHVGRMPEAEAQYRRALEMDPAQPYGHFNVGWTLLYQNKPKDALVEMQQEDDSRRDLGLAYAYHGMGRHGDSKAALAAYVKGHPDDSMNIAGAYAYRGEVNEAFAWLERAERDHVPWLSHVKGDPDFNSLMSDPRYKLLLGRLNLPD
jgi:tetratricopeptide (TPR) repeat protein